jgi:hypothetical protein
MKLKGLLLLASLITGVAIGGYLLLGFSQSCLCPNVVSMELQSATLYSGSTASGSTPATSRLTFAVENFETVTYISSITLDGSNLTSPITKWSTNSYASGLINLTNSMSNRANELNSNTLLNFTFYPVTTESSLMIVPTQTYNYVIFFGNNQSISGSLIAV